MMSKFFYDSYAIIAHFTGDKNYQSYFIEHSGVTSFYNAMEVYYAILKREGEKEAHLILQHLIPLIVYPDFNDIEPAMKFRLKHNKHKLSYADCLGYILASKHNVKFLTGDKEFASLPNVEFIRSSHSM